MLMQKESRTTNSRHVAWVRGLPCAASSLTCNGGTQAHHLLRPWVGGRGMGMKADDRNVIPLCLFHHSQLHTKYGSENSFFTVHARDDGYAQELAEHLWQDSPYHR